MTYSFLASLAGSCFNAADAFPQRSRAFKFFDELGYMVAQIDFLLVLLEIKRQTPAPIVMLKLSPEKLAQARTAIGKMIIARKPQNAQ
ncbi:MAG: hypothetical protein WC505_07585 [Patescibacteria group bacterium]